MSNVIKKTLSEFVLSETGKLNDDVFTIKGKMVNMYLVKANEGKYIAIDTADDKALVKKGLEQLGINKDDISVMFLTHSDRDHIEGIPLFNKAALYVPDKEVTTIKGEVDRNKYSGYNRYSVEIGEYKVLTNNEELGISGLKIKVINTPGHTYGSASYIVNDKYIFTGDLLSLKDNKAELFPDMFNVDDALDAESISNIARLNGIKYIFTGHYGYTDDFDSAMKEWR